MHACMHALTTIGCVRVSLSVVLSFVYRFRSHQSHCQVRYEIIAEVFQKPNSLLHKNPHSKEPLTIIAMPSNSNNSNNSNYAQQPTPRTLPTEIIPISNCHCCRCCSCTKIGTMALETKLNTTTLLLDEPSMPQQHHRRQQQHCNNFSSSRYERNNNNHHPKNAFRVEFRCENKSTANVNTVQSTLTETIEFCVRGHTKTITKTLSSATVDDTSRYPELKPMWRRPFFFQEHKRGTNGNGNGSDTSLLLRHVPWRELHLGVQARSALDTYNGRAVQVRHVLTVALVTKECCTTNPDASTRVELYRNPLVFGDEQQQQQQQQQEGVANKNEHQQSSGFANENEQQSYHHATTPTAPFEDEPSFGKATASIAPSAFYDTINNNNSNNSNNNSNNTVPMVEAQLVLPEDWNAYAEEVVTIPIAQATVVDR